MTFPDSKFNAIDGYCDAYFEEIRRAAASVDRTKLVAAARLLEDVNTRGATLFSCGNGGSAAIANHLVCDHLKGVRTDTDLTPRVISLSTNMEMITAIANDISYFEVFAYQLSALAKPGDLLLTISASGDSENVVRAALWARDNGLGVIAFTGFGGGRVADLATVHLHVEADNYGIIEDVHQSLMHMLAQYLRQSRMSETLIADRKF